VRRREDEGVRVDALEGVDADAVLADRDADDLEAGRAGDRDGVVVGARVLDHQPPGAGLAQRLDDEPDALGVAVADDDLLGPGRRAAHAVEIGGERVPERGAPWPRT
jgi:hypothetical protein